MEEPRYTKSWATSSAWSESLMSGGVPVSCPYDLIRESDVGWSPCILPHDLRFLLTDCQPKGIACLTEAVHEQLEFLSCMGRDCCIVREKEIAKAFLLDFGLGPEPGEIIKFTV